jgi:hypothetical protein
MSWKIAILVALLAGVITAVVTAPVADKVSRMLHVSDFEGGRGMLIAFLLVPAGFLGGFGLGLLGTRLVNAVEWVQFWKAAGVSIGLGQVALFGIAGLCLLGMPRPPLIDGHALALRFEVYVPLALIPDSAQAQDQIRLSLYASDNDNGFATIDRSLFREEDGQLVVTADATLNSKSTMRLVSFYIQDTTWLAADVDLPASPGKENLVWSKWKPMRDANTSGSNSVFSEVQIRYRVVEQ